MAGFAPGATSSEPHPVSYDSRLRAAARGRARPPNATKLYGGVTNERIRGCFDDNETPSESPRLSCDGGGFGSWAARNRPSRPGAFRGAGRSVSGRSRAQERDCSNRQLSKNRRGLSRLLGEAARSRHGRNVALPRVLHQHAGTNGCDANGFVAWNGERGHHPCPRGCNRESLPRMRSGVQRVHGGSV